MENLEKAVEFVKSCKELADEKGLDLNYLINNDGVLQLVLQPKKPMPPTEITAE